MKNIILKTCFTILIAFVLNIYTAESIVKPIGGEDGSFWRQNTVQKIMWDTSDFHGLVNIYIWNMDSGDYIQVDTNIQADLGEYSWTIPSDNPVGNNFRIKILQNDSMQFTQFSYTFFPIYQSGMGRRAVFSQNEEENNSNKDEDLRDEFTIQLSNNSPNPFVHITEIKYFVSINEHVKLSIFDINGKVITTLVDKYEKGGWHTAIINGSGLTPGAYNVVLESNGQVTSRVIIKE